MASAVGLARLALHDVGSGLALLAGALVARWLVSVAVDEWADAGARRVRDGWRARITSHLGRPRREGERSRADLALAIEHASGEPALEAMRAGAAVSLLGVVAVFVAAGALSAVVVVALLVVAAPLYQRAGRRSATLEADYLARRAQLEARQLEVLTRSTELRALGAVPYGADTIAALSDSEHALAVRAIRVALGSSLVTEFLSGVSVGLVAMVVGFALLGGRLSLEHGLVAVLVTAELFSAVRRYGSEFHRRERMAQGRALLGSSSTVSSAHGPDILAARGLVTEVGGEPLDLRVTLGSRTLVTGPSGSGKTTLLQTLVGWRAPREGSLELGDAPVGFVSAESALISGSLWENLTLGAPVDSSDVTDVLERLGLTGPRFEDLSSPVLADGRGLSSGEVVRLVLARAILARPSLLVIDDVAGVLDEAGRERVSDVLGSLAGIAIVEATVEAPLVRDATSLVRVGV